MQKQANVVNAGRGAYVRSVRIGWRAGGVALFTRRSGSGALGTPSCWRGRWRWSRRPQKRRRAISGVVWEEVGRVRDVAVGVVSCPRARVVHVKAFALMRLLSEV